jgi:NADH-quinone oxidoreductase subunit J
MFVLLGAPFVGALQILIYTGAILVLFLFVIMLLNVTREEAAVATQKVQTAAALLGALVFGGMIALLLWNARRPVDPLTQDFVSMKSLARGLFTDYLLPFEIVGLLLLVAVIGATVAARRPPQQPDEYVQSGFEPRVEIHTDPEEP